MKAGEADEMMDKETDAFDRRAAPIWRQFAEWTITRSRDGVQPPSGQEPSIRER
jgi:hypothetical protein